MIAGPGTIATVLLLVNLSRGDRLDLVVVVARLCGRAARDVALHARFLDCSCK